MWHRSGVAKLALLSAFTLAVAQECPPGYAKGPKVTWVDCPTSNNEDLQCSTLEVPADWTQPNGAKIKLRLVRQPASDKNAKSIIINPGGPGESGIKAVVDGGSDYQDIVGTGFHIIGFDPRGVGLTTPYLCPDTNVQNGLYDSPAGLEQSVKYNTAQGNECAAAKYKSDLIGTAFVARDIKAIAEALGEDGLIRYWGYSYGTLLGATLAAMFPDQVDRVFLDGNINPIDYYNGLGFEGSTDFDKSVTRFFEECAEAGPSFCDIAKSGQTGTQVQDTFNSFLSTLKYGPGRSLRQELYEAMYFKNESSWTLMAKRINHYYANPSALGKRSLDRRQSQLDWKPDYANVNTPNALIGITCGDVVTRYPASPEYFLAYIAEYEATSQYGGDIAIDLLFSCTTWTVNAKERYMGDFSGIKTRNPILFANGQYDPVTPAISAQNSAAGFVGSKVLLSSGIGHCTNANESPELNAAIKTYFIDGTFPKVDQIYTPKVQNVFKSNAKRTLSGPNLRNRDVEVPAFFKREANLVARTYGTDSIPAGCTKIASSTSVRSSTRSSTRASSTSARATTSSATRSSSISSSASSSSVRSSSASSSSVRSSSASSSSVRSSSASSSSVRSSSSSVASSTNVYPASTPSSAASSSSSSVASSTKVYPASTPSSAAQSSSSSAASSTKVYPASTPSSAAQSSVASSTKVYPVSTPSSAARSVSSSSAVYNGGYSASVSSVGGYNAYAPSSSVAQGYGGYNVYLSASSAAQGYGGYNVYPSSSSMAQGYGGYNVYASSSSVAKGYGGYNSAYPVTNTPCPTPAWSSQPGYVPYTKTYTTTTVQTITACGRDYKNCPINSATPTVYITSTKTATTVIAIPTTTVYVTKVVDVCSTGLTTQTVTVTQTCKSGCTARVTGVPQGYTTTVKYCAACATPSTVTVTYCTACANMPSATPVKGTPIYVPSKPSSPASMIVVVGTPVVPAKPSNTPVYGPPVVGTPLIQTPPAVGTPVNPVKPSTWKSNSTSTLVYGCSGPKCVATPTGYQPAQFTGSASRAHGSFALVASTILALAVVFGM